MKKTIAWGIVFLLLVAGLSTVSAGGSRESAEETKTGPIEISFWSLFTGGDGEFFDAMIEEFNRAHDDIEMTTDTVRFDNYYTKLTTALTAGNAPDVVVVHRDRLLDYVSQGVLYPLNDLMDDVNAPLNDFVPAALDGCTFDGTIYSIPLDVHPLILYYNNDLFAAAGVTSVPRSYAEVIGAAQAVQATGIPMGIALDNTTATYKAYTLTRLFMSFIAQQGGSLLNADLTAADFNNEKGAAALEALIDMVNVSHVTPAGLDYDSSVAAFKLGNAAMHINGVWATGGFEQQEGLNFTAVPLPPMFGQPAAWSGSHTLAIPVRADMDQARLEAIAEFMMWMTANGDLWAKAGHVPTRISVASKPEFTALPHRKDYAGAAESSFPAPRTAAWGEIYGNLSDSLEYAVATNQDVGEALADMEEMVNGILASY